MEERSLIKPSIVDLAPWLFIVVIIVIVFAPLFYETQKYTRLVVERPMVTKQAMVSKNVRGEQIIQGQSKAESALGKMLDESNMVNIPSSLPEKYPVSVSESSSLSVHEKKDEHFFHPIIFQAANRYQVDVALVKAIIMAESGYNSNAISREGAEGLMQLMPRTSEALGVEDSFDPEHNINGGVRYFKQLLNQFDGDVKLALAAYNAGSKKVRKYQSIPPFRETQYYVKKVFEYYQHYKKQADK